MRAVDLASRQATPIGRRLTATRKKMLRDVGPPPVGHFLRPHARLPPSVALGGRAVAQHRSGQRLAGILAADLVAYGRLMRDDEEVK
jgi:hypothetical protein